MIPTYYAGGERPLTPDDISQSEAKIIEQIIIKSPTIPTASVEELGKVRMFTGETGAVYTHGYIYECTAGDTIYTGTVTFQPATISGTVVACDGDTFANFVATGGDDPEAVVSGTMTYHYASSIWVLSGLDADGNEIAHRQIYQPDYEDAGFTFTGTPADGDVVTFVCTVEEDHTEYSWNRVDVQPVTDLTSLENRVTAIEDVVPAQATAQNQLADKAFVNSSISTNTANFIGTFNSVADLEAYSGTVTNNDYAFVTSTDAAGNTLYNRYKYNGTAWVFEYALNNSGFTASQWAAINSGATAAAITSMQTTSNLVTSISSSSTDTQYPSAKCVYDIVGNIETLLQGV